MFQKSYFCPTLKTTTNDPPASGGCAKDNNATTTNNNQNTKTQGNLLLRPLSPSATSYINQATTTATTTTTGASPTCKDTKPQSLILHTSCRRRIVIAIATLRLTSATSSSTSTVASTSVGSSIGATCLKSLLAGCYYILAFASLLLLILYINHVVATQNGADNNSNHHHHHNRIQAAQPRPHTAAEELVTKWAALKYSKYVGGGGSSSSSQKMDSMISAGATSQNESHLNFLDHDNHLEHHHVQGMTTMRVKRSAATPLTVAVVPVVVRNAAELLMSTDHETSLAAAAAAAAAIAPTGNKQQQTPSTGKTSSRFDRRIKAFFRSNGNYHHLNSQAASRKSDLDLQDPPSSASSDKLLQLEPPPSTKQHQHQPQQRSVNVAPPKQPQPTTATATTATTRSSTLLPELTDRQASYSPNNRGVAMTNTSLSSISPSSGSLSSRQHQAAESQWIPILMRQEPSARVGSPAAAAASVQPSSQAALAAASSLNNGAPELLPPPASAVYHTTTHVEGTERLRNRHRHSSSSLKPPANNRDQRHHHHQLTDSSHHHHSYSHRYHQTRNSHHRDGRQWRRPRLNGIGGPMLAPPMPSKMYKRVLLCDKTLVSLDYVRNLEPEPRPSFDGTTRAGGGSYETGAESDDNFIDLDSNFANRMAAAAGTAAVNGSSNQQQPEASASTILVVAADSSAEPRRSYLTDEDPLVKCDMWDLEKGLKNRKPPKEILQMAVRADFDTVRDAINRCRQLSEKTLPPDDEYRDGIEIMSTEDLVSLFSMKRGLIPGTKWCGLGDQASSYNDLGPKHRIDICCRAHDHCPIRLKPFRNDYGVLNIALYTKSHCDCDADFYRCLREVHSRTADMLGNLYFNVMKLQCIREERMKICREMRPIALGFERCVRYEDSRVKTVFKFTTPPVAY